MFPTTSDLDTELSAVNSILGSIGQSPVTELDFENPEISFVYQLLSESNRDTQNEGWVYNTERNYPLVVNSDGHIPVPNNMLRVDASGNQVDRTTDFIKRGGNMYDKIAHTDTFTPGDTLYADIVWLFDFEDLPSVFKRYITLRASVRAAVQLVANRELATLLASQEAYSRAACLEYECNQGDYNFMGNPDGTVYRGYVPYFNLIR